MDKEEDPDKPQMELVSILVADLEPGMTHVTCKEADPKNGVSEDEEQIILLLD